jgi:Zn-dependent protease with chaperone function
VIAPLLLVGYAIAVVLIAPRVLVRMPMLWRSPRTGLALWQCAVVGVLSALALLLVGALVPTTAVSLDWGHLVHACHPSALTADTLTGLGGVRLLSTAVASGTLLRLLWATVTRTRAMVRSRRRQRYLLDLLAPQQASDWDQPGMHVLTSDVPAAYCIPGGQGRIVLTSGAVLALSDRQRAAVIAHERAHLCGRHDLVLLGADIAATAFGSLSFFRTARTQLSWLLEMLADDAAARRTAPGDVAAALAGIGTHSVPDAAVAAGGHIVPVRVARMLAHQAPASRAFNVTTLIAATAVLLTPWALALAPVLAVHPNSCPG